MPPTVFMYMPVNACYFTLLIFKRNFLSVLWEVFEQFVGAFFEKIFNVNQIKKLAGRSMKIKIHS